ncbi:MAG: OmpA family protein [Fibrobacteraceae bacterium]|nr:OmpA family protein [Fibrobacteraceae bacterium]
MEKKTHSNKSKLILLCALFLIVLFFAIYFISSKDSKSVSLAKSENSLVQSSGAIKGYKEGTPDDSLSVSEQAQYTSIIAEASPTRINGAVTNIDEFNQFMKKSNGQGNSIEIPSIGILFDFNTTDVKKSNFDLISAFAKIYKQTNKKALILVEGYTCDIGTNETNDLISQQRAENVKALLIQNKVPAEKIELKWYGESKYGLFHYLGKEYYRRSNISIK